MIWINVRSIQKNIDKSSGSRYVSSWHHYFIDKWCDRYQRCYNVTRLELLELEDCHRHLYELVSKTNTKTRTNRLMNYWLNRNLCQCVLILLVVRPSPFIIVFIWFCVWYLIIHGENPSRDEQWVHMQMTDGQTDNLVIFRYNNDINEHEIEEDNWELILNCHRSLS